MCKYKVNITCLINTEDFKNKDQIFIQIESSIDAQGSVVVPVAVDRQWCDKILTTEILTLGWANLH